MAESDAEFFRRQLDTIESLRAENERLRALLALCEKALKPYWEWEELHESITNALSARDGDPATRPRTLDDVVADASPEVLEAKAKFDAYYTERQDNSDS